MRYYILNEEDVCIQVVDSKVVLNHNDNIVPIDDDFAPSHIFDKYDRGTGEWSIPVNLESYFINNEMMKLNNVKTDTASINTTTTMTSEDALLLMEMMLDIQKQLAKLNPTV